MDLTVSLSFLLLVMVVATCPHSSSAQANCTISQFSCTDGSACVDMYEKCDGTNACSDDSDESATTCPEGSEPIPEDYLVVGDANFGALFQVQISTGMVHRLAVTASSEPKGIAIDPQTGDLYYADDSSKSIKRLEWSTKTVTVIYDDIATSSKLSGVALDTERRMIYYADSDAENIIEIKIDDDTYKRTVQTGARAETLIFDNANKMLYWSDVGSNSGIYKCSATEDSAAAVPVITENIEYPIGFAIDWSESKIYWTEALLHSIHSANLDGSNPVLIREEVSWKGSFWDITVTPNHIFFLEASYYAIRGFDKYTGDFHQYTEQRFKNFAYMTNNITDDATCMRDYEHCSTGAGCVYKYFICDGENDCADGSDEATLCPGGKKEYLTDNYLLVADDMHSSFFQVDPSTGDIVYVGGPDLTMPWTVAVNPTNGDIYYADDAEKKIARFSMATKETTTIHEPTGPLSFGSVCLDYENNVLYFSNNEAPGYIAKINLDDNTVTMIYENATMVPRTGLFLVTVDDKRALYWSDSGLFGIFYVPVDQPDPEIVTVIAGLPDPDGFAVDISTGEMFWADSSTNLIEKANLAGSNRQTVLNDVKGRIYRSMTLSPQYIYYTDATTSYIRKIDRTTFAAADYTDQRFAALSAIRFVESTMTTVAPASTQSGDNSAPCSIRQFQCGGETCVSIYAKCDGTDDCSDNSDESSGTCPAGTEPYLQEDYLVVSDEVLGYLYQVQVSTGHVRRLPITGPVVPKGVAVDSQTNDIYYCDQSERAIKVLEWATKTVKTIYEFTETSVSLHGIALDMQRRVLYYTEHSTDTIGEVGIDNGEFRLVQSAVIASSLVLDSQNNMLYWTQMGDNPGIFKCSSTEALPQAELIITENIKAPSGLAIDWQAGTMYWLEQELHSVEKASLDGSNRETIRKEVSWKGPFNGLTNTPNHIFFTEGNYYALRGFEKYGTDFHQYTDQSFKSLYHVSSNISNPDLCMRDYERCSTGSGCVYKYYICDGENDCADGSDEATLCPGGKKEYLTDNYLLVADDMHESFFQVDPSTGDIVYVSGLDTTMPWTTAVNPNTGDIYYADDAEQRIARFSMATKEITTILEQTDPIGFGSITLDAEANVLYFSNNEAPAYLAAIDLSDNSVRKIYENSDMYPRTGLFLDKEERVLYWSDSLLHGIYKISVDTAGAEPVVVLSGIDDPDGFTVDFKTGELFWADSTTSTIEKAKLDGSNRQVMLNDVKGHIYRSMTSDSQYIYYTDATTSYIRKIDRTSFAAADYTDQGFAALSAIRFVQSIMTTTEGPSTTSGGSAGSTTQASGPSGQSTQGGGPTGPSTQGGGQTGPSTQSGGPSGPSTQSGGPTGPSTQGGEQTGPSTQSGGPSGPSTQSGGPSGQSTQGGGPSGPSTQGGGPSGQSTQGGGPSGPSTQGGGPSGPSTQSGGPSGPSTQGGGPSGPSTQGGGPSGPSTQGGGPSGESTTVGSSQSTGSSGGNKSKIIAIVVPIAVAVGAIIAILIVLACSSFGGPSGMASTGATAAAGGYNPYGQEGFRPGAMRRNPGNYNDGYRIA